MKLKQFLKTVFIFLTGNMLSKLVSFFLLPLYTGRIDPEQFGQYDLAFSLINLVVPIAFFQIWDGMYRFAFDYTEELDKQKVIGNACVVCGVGMVVYMAAFAGLNYFYHFAYSGYILVYGLLYALYYLHTYAARIFLKNRLFVLSGLLATLITALLNIVLILVFHWDVKSIYFSSCMGMVAQILLLECKIRVFRCLSAGAIDKKLIWNMLKFSVPLCVATVSYWLLSGFTKVLIQGVEGDYANGLFAVSNRFASIITLVVTALQFAWNEAAYIMTGEEEQERKNSYTLCVNFMLVGVVFGTAILCPVVKIIFPYVINAQYNEALSLIPVTILGVAANSAASFLGTMFMADKKNGVLVQSTFIASVINIAFGYFAVRVVGVQGANIVLAASFFALVFLRLGRIVKDYQLRLQDGKLVLALLMLLVSLLGYYHLESLEALLLLCIGFVLVFCVCMKEYMVLFLEVLKNRKN